MGQSEIIELLNEHKGRWMTSKEIAKALGVAEANDSLRVLRRLNMIRFKDGKSRYKPYRYSV